MLQRRDEAQGATLRGLPADYGDGNCGAAQRPLTPRRRDSLIDGKAAESGENGRPKMVAKRFQKGFFLSGRGFGPQARGRGFSAGGVSATEGRTRRRARRPDCGGQFSFKENRPPLDTPHRLYFACSLQ